MDQKWLGGLALVGGLIVLMKSTLAAKSPSLQAFAQAIAGAEGFGTPGAIPTVRNNPGDLTDSTGAIQTFASADAGWQALYNQLDLVASGGSAYYTPAMTIAEFASIYTATEVSAWTANVVAFLQAQGYADASADSSISEWLS